MNTNLNTQVPVARGITGEGWAAIAGAVGSALLVLKRLFSSKGSKRELLTRTEFYAETLEIRERLNANHLALLEKLQANHRELLGAIGREAARLSGLEAGFARLDERTRK
jgi:hypothetical protein